MPTTATAPGARFIQALAEHDLDAARSLLDPDITLGALLPQKSLAKVGRDEVLAQFCTFMELDSLQSVEILDDHDVGGRRSLAYRAHWSTADAGLQVFEQQAFYDETDGVITWVHLTCSGDLPVI